jgi:hypothetical protein
MKRHYQRISQVLTIAIVAIASATISPVFAQSTQPQKGDAARLRLNQDQPISPTNTDQFSIERDMPRSDLKIQNINFDVEAIQPVIPGNYNASPQKVNRSGTFISDPLNAIQIFQESGTSRREK